jgi:Holliday junction resolvase
MMSPDQISKLAFLLYPHITKTALDEPSTESLATRIQQIHQGLSPEDEFAAKVCWLGNCAGINRIDQTPMPITEVGGKMRAPDFIAFPIVGGAPLPVLIEVKSHHEDRLDFSDAYLSSLRRFADLMKLPLLVAWRCGGLWTLFDHREISQNVTAYRMTLMDAIRQDLSCALFRDLRIQMNPELEFILGMELLDEVDGDAGEIIPAGTYIFKIRSGGFYNGGVEIAEYDPAHFSLFMAAPDESELRRTGKQAFQQIFRPAEGHGFNLSNVLVAQLSMIAGTDAEIDWHQTVMKPFPSSGAELRKTLQSAIEIGFVRYVMDIIPNDWPDFFPESSRTGRVTVHWPLGCGIHGL